MRGMFLLLTPPPLFLLLLLLLLLLLVVVVVVVVIVVVVSVEGKGKVHPGTSEKAQSGSRGIAVLFL